MDIGTNHADHTRPIADCFRCNLDHADTLTRVAKPRMVLRSLRVPLKLWEEAKAKADERQENISDVIREALERYIKKR